MFDDTNIVYDEQLKNAGIVGEERTVPRSDNEKYIVCGFENSNFKIQGKVFFSKCYIEEDSTIIVEDTGQAIFIDCEVKNDIVVNGEAKFENCEFYNGSEATGSGEVETKNCEYN